MNGRDIIKKISLLMLMFGALLILLNLLGYVVAPNVLDEKFSQQPKQDGIPGYAFQTHDTSLLIDMLEKPMAKFDLEKVNNEIFGAIVHTDRRRIQPYENWLLWLAGKMYKPLARTQSPARIVSGEGAFCSEVAAVMNHVATLNGYQARFIELNGHVVSEVLTETGWRVADADYGVTYPVGIKVLEGEEGSRLIRQALLSRGYNEDNIVGYTKLVQSPEDNEILSVGMAMSPRLYLVETTTEVLKWIIPLLAIILGVIGIKRHRS
ncbi:MAG: hypothetical protein V3U84_11765 [Thiotrichaceae bacterium]